MGAKVEKSSGKATATGSRECSIIGVGDAIRFETNHCHLTSSTTTSNHVVALFIYAREWVYIVAIYTGVDWEEGRAL
jgi:hypothetical protein